MDSPDLQTKYQKLATEYSRLRAQIPVLKKGVLDEQAKSDALKNEVKIRDQKVRKYEQEVDSLTFRNDQLTKRVSVLQQELDSSKNTRKNKHDRTVWHAPNEDPVPRPMPSENESVLSEELQSKIEENARLHKEMYEINMKHNEAMIVLQNQLARYERESNEHTQAMESLSSAFKAQVDALIEEKAMLEVKLLSMDSQSKQLKNRADSAELQLCNISQELSLGLTSSFSQDDVSRSVSVQSFAATPDLDDNRELAQVVLEAVAIGKQFTHSLSNYYMYSEQRLSNFPGQLSELGPLLLGQAANHIKPLNSALKNLAEHSNDKNMNLSELAEGYSKFVDYHAEVTVLLINCLEKESVDADSNLSLKNKELHKTFESFQYTLKPVSDCLNKLVIAVKSGRELSTIERPYRELVSSLQSVLESARELSKQYNAKVSLEQRLDASHKFKTANECVVSSLISLVTVLDKLTSLLRSSTDTVTKPQYSGHSPASMKSVDSLDTSSITQQVATLKDKLLTLESDREHWMLESQLLQAKLEEKSRIIHEMEKQMNKPDDMEANIIRAPDTISQDSAEHSPYLDLSMLGTVNRPGESSACDSSSHTGNDVTLREKLIKQYYATRLSDLTAKLHLADSKCVNFYHETHSLHQRFTAVEKAKSRVEAELDLSINDCKQLKEELSTTSARYEDQMNLMSEHIAQLNDQLTAHKEQIDSYKIALKSKK